MVVLLSGFFSRVGHRCSKLMPARYRGLKGGLGSLGPCTNLASMVLCEKGGTAGQQQPGTPTRFGSYSGGGGELGWAAVTAESMPWQEQATQQRSTKSC